MNSNLVYILISLLIFHSLGSIVDLRNGTFKSGNVIVTQVSLEDVEMTVDGPLSVQHIDAESVDTELLISSIVSTQFSESEAIYSSVRNDSFCSRNSKRS